MAISSLAMLVSAIGLPLVVRLTDDDGDGEPDAAVVADLVAETDGLIVGNVGRLYDVNVLFANPPPTLLGIARRILVHKAYERRPDFNNERGETPVIAGYKDALSLLASVGSSKFQLDVGGIPVGPAANAGGGAPSTSALTGLPTTTPFFSGGGGGIF